MAETKTLCPLCAEIADVNSPAVAIADANPVTEGHLLIVPTRHVERVTELQDREWRTLHELIRVTLREMEADPGVDGVTVGINSGPAAGQTVPHAHVHLIPRRTGDCPDPRGGIRWVIRAKADYWTT